MPKSQLRALTVKLLLINILPDGEIFYAPVDESAEGYTNYDLPAIYQGKEVDNIYLEFKKGEVVKSNAAKNLDLLENVLQTDAGSRRIGECGIATSYGITRFSKDILFDEKIGGTFHPALGRAYPRGGGKNEPAIHWDMVKDLPSGEIYPDGKLVQEKESLKSSILPAKIGLQLFTATRPAAYFLIF